MSYSNWKEEKKICPFIYNQYQDGQGYNITCQEEKCMAWGVIDYLRITDDRQSVEWGCKLIAKEK